MIKKLIMIVLAVLLMVPLVVAQEEVDYNPYGIEWDANTEEDMWRYRVYTADTASGQVKGEEYAVITIPFGVENYVFPADMADETGYWRVTAVDKAKNESAFSVIELKLVFDHTPPAPVTGCSVMQKPEPEPTE